MTQYAGLCIGGPLAGQSVVSQSTILVVETHPPTKMLREAVVLAEREKRPPDIRVGQVRYHWLHTGGLGLWIVEGKTMNDAIEMMAVAYAASCKQ